MIRVLLVLGLAVAALIGLALRLERDGNLEALEKVRGPEVRTFDLGDALAATSREFGVDQVVAEVTETVTVAGDSVEMLVEKAKAVRPLGSPAEPTSSSPARPEPEPASEPPTDLPIEEIELESPDGWSEFVGPPEPPEASPEPTLVARVLDQDEWATLIRRMLHVYERTDRR